MKAKSSLEKLRDNHKSSEKISSINEGVIKTNSVDFQANNTGLASDKHHNSRNGNLRQKKVAFSDIEDNFIRHGIFRHGNGRWTAILNDLDFKFHPSRKPCTLAVRAKRLNM